MKRLVSVVCALLFLVGCGSVKSVTSVPSQSVAHILSPSPMPNPHLMTSIDSQDILNITPAQAAPYLTIAHTNASPNQTNPFEDVGIYAIPYTDINHFIPSSNSGTNPFLSMAVVAKTCDGHYVEWVKPDHPVTYVTDPRNIGTLEAWEAWYTNFAQNGGEEWATYEDTADNPYTFAVPAPPCAADGSGPVTTQEWTAAEEVQEGAMQAFTGKPVIFNGLAPGYHTSMPLADALLDGPVAGGEAEACAPHNTTEWLNQIAIEIHAVQRQKYFVCHGNDTSDGSTPTAIAFRNYHFASMMLEFDPKYTIYESYFAVGASGLGVQPESTVVMQRPYKTVATIADLLRTTGAYARRYAQCYVGGTLVGECAAVVNPTPVAVGFPWAAGKYNHTMVLSGSGIYDGGTVSASGPPPDSTVAPYSGEVVFL